mmetsp:Transcript_85764/g.135454  ORF Transcript_85764/g.135454 Transcript_85764/m.135454 type:complete len:658 (-) Transcript_85764:98-2071(-)
MAAANPQRWAQQVKKAAKTCLDLCRELVDASGPAFDAVTALDEALSSEESDPTRVMKLALKALDTTVTCGMKMRFANGILSHSGKKAHLIKRKVQPLTWISKDLSKLFKDCGDFAGLGASKVTQGHLVKCRIDQPDAPNQLLKIGEEAVKVFKDIGDVVGEATALQSLIDGHRIKAALSPFANVKNTEATSALELAQTQLELFKSAKDLRGESEAMHNIAQMYMSDGREGEKDDKFKADEMAELSFKLALKLGDKDLEVETLQTLMAARLATEGAYEVERLAEEATRRWRRRASAGWQKEEAWAIRTAADALLNMGEVDEAIEKARESLSICEKEDDKEGQAAALLIIYSCLKMQGNEVEASETLKEAIELYRRLDDKRSEAVALLQAIEAKISNMKLPQLADCFFSRDVQEPNYNVADADAYRKGDEAMRMAKRAVALFTEADEQGGQEAVDNIIQDAIERAIQAHVKTYQPIQEKIKLDADEKKTQSRVGVWLVQLPRMLSAAQSDEERARAILRIERDPPKRRQTKMKAAQKKKPVEDSSESDEESDDDEEEQFAAIDAAPTQKKVKLYEGPSLDELKDGVKATALDLIGADGIEYDSPLMDAGLDSLAAVEFQGILSKQYAGLSLPGTLMFDHPNISGIAALMDTELRAAAGF